MKAQKFNSQVPDSFQAFLCRGAEFTKVEEYPILRSEMIPTVAPKKILPFNKAINFHGDLSDTYICTYSADATFERVRRNPQLYLNFFRRTAGIIGFDFSVHSDMPVVKQKAQIFDNLSLSFYYGNRGVSLIPNLRCGIDELMPEYFTAIPKHSMVAVGTYGFIKTVPEKYEWLCFLEEVIEKLEPTSIIVYGSLGGHIFDSIKEKTSFIIYDSWISARNKEVQNNVN